MVLRETFIREDIFRDIDLVVRFDQIRRGHETRYSSAHALLAQGSAPVNIRALPQTHSELKLDFEGFLYRWKRRRPCMSCH